MAEILDERREPLPRRVLVVATALVLLAAIAGWLVDRRVAGREERALAACEEAADRAVDRAFAPVRSSLEYVRPVLSGAPPGRLRRGMYAIVSEAALGAQGRLDGVRADCAAVDVVWVHPALRERRDDCVRRLDGHGALLRAIAADGRAIGVGLPSSPGPC